MQQKLGSRKRHTISKTQTETQSKLPPSLRTVIGALSLSMMVSCAVDDGPSERKNASSSNQENLSEDGSLNAVSSIARTYGVYFQTLHTNQYMVAENGGGGIVNANRSTPRGWERFEILDQNAGQLMHNDEIYIRTFDGRFLQVTNGTSSSLNAGGTDPQGWELNRV